MKHLTLLLGFLFFNIGINYGQNTDRQQDSLALVALYNATDGENWTKKENWLTGNLDTWYGIKLDKTGRVKKIGLWTNNLKGNIPAEIGNLSNLKTLIFEVNQLSGSIPIEIGKLTNLKELYLNNNKLTGSIPNEIGKLKNIEQLFLDRNQLTGNIPNEIGNLIKLKNFFLYDNQLTGNIPPEIGNLTKLLILALNYNQLTGTVPKEIGNLTNLMNLNLEHNQLTGDIPIEISNLTKLQYLHLHYNKFTKIYDISSISKLRELKTEVNNLDFKDLEDANVKPSTKFTYSSQKKRKLSNSKNKNQQTTLICNTEDALDNTYQWYRNNELIPNETNKTINSNISGKYKCKVLNKNFPNLILETEEFEIKPFEIAATTSLAENIREIKLYPNPAKNIINIKSEGLENVKLFLFDFAGRKQNIRILNKNSNQIQIDISDKKAGAYFLQILIDNKFIKTSKFIVVK